MAHSYRTTIQLAFADMADSCGAMSATPIAMRRPVFDDEPEDLRALKELLMRFAKAADEVVAEITLQAGLKKADHADCISNLIHDEVAAAIGALAKKIDADRDEGALFVPRARLQSLQHEHSTLNHRQQF